MMECLHYITKDDAGFSHEELCELACAAGVPLVQLRRKNVSEQELLASAKACREITGRYGVKLIINDHVDIALEVGADGVHLGLGDLDTGEARKRCPKDFVIGGTANSFEDLVHHYANGVDYVGLGPFRFTSTKERLSPVLGIEGYRMIVQRMREVGMQLPVIAIGGITLEDCADLKESGVHGIAVSALITEAADKERVVKTVLKKWKYAEFENS